MDQRTFFGIQVIRQRSYACPPDHVFVYERVHPRRAYIVTAARELTDAELFSALAAYMEKYSEAASLSSTRGES